MTENCATLALSIKIIYTHTHTLQCAQAQQHPLIRSIVHSFIRSNQIPDDFICNSLGWFLGTNSMCTMMSCLVCVCVALPQGTITHHYRISSTSAFFCEIIKTRLKYDESTHLNAIRWQWKQSFVQLRFDIIISSKIDSISNPNDATHAHSYICVALILLSLPLSFSFVFLLFFFLLVSHLHIQSLFFISQFIPEWMFVSVALHQIYPNVEATRCLNERTLVVLLVRCILFVGAQRSVCWMLFGKLCYPSQKHIANSESNRIKSEGWHWMRKNFYFYEFRFVWMNETAYD